MEKCARCDAGENEVKLFDVIYEGKVNPMCERCSIIENIPIITKPNLFQVKESQRGVSVYNRMRRITGFKESKKSEETLVRKERLEQLRKNPRLEIPERKRIDLIEHFHWEIMRTRRRRGFTQKQLAAAIGEPEVLIDVIEKGNVPADAENLVRKLEKFLNIRLRKTSFFEEKDTIKKKPVLLDENGIELDKIPEPEIEIKEKEEEFSEEISESEVKKSEGKKETAEREDFYNKNKDFDLDRADVTRVRISDLRELNRRRIEATKQEKIEEQRKIEDRQRLIEARKEELRLLKEKQSKEVDNMLGGTELLKENHSGNDV